MTVDGKPADLTAREYAMAEHLIQKRGFVISRDYLYDHLFDENDESLSEIRGANSGNSRQS